MYKDVFIVAPLRTPVGKYGGALSGVRPDDLAALVMGAVVIKAGLDPAVIDDVIIGCANQAGEDNRNVARMALLLAGIPNTVPGVTVNRLCASSLEAIVQGARAIECADAHVVLAGGVESMSRAPYSLPKNVSGRPLFGNITAFDTALGWRYPNPALEKMFPLEAMGETAENIAERWQISRAHQDEYAVSSHQRAVNATDMGVFADEIIPVPVSVGKGQVSHVTVDEMPRRDASVSLLAVLKPAFRRDGTVTAGNSSALNDGAAAMLLASAEAIKKYGLKPIARIIASATVGVDPRIMGIGPVGAIRKAVGNAGLTLQDISAFEINEAFAVQTLACLRELGIETDACNIHGGAIAIGHPLGMSGARIAGHLAHTLHQGRGRYGVASLCVGVGQGMALVIEKV